MRRVWLSSWVWLGFAVVFAALASYHFWAATRLAPPLEFHPRSITQIPGLQIAVQIAGIDQPIQDFTDQFNAYLRKQNTFATLSNLAAGWGYVVAFLVAVLCFFKGMSGQQAFEPNHADQTFAGNQRREP